MYPSRTNLLLLIFSLASVNLIAQSGSALAFFDALNSRHSAINQKNIEYLQYSVHSDDMKTIVQKRLELILKVEEVRSETRKMQAPAEAEQMKNEFLAILDIYHESFQQEFARIENLKENSKESYEAMEEFIKAQSDAEKILGEAAERFQNSQRAFAKANNIQLLAAEANSEITQLNQLNSYQRALFLRSFRVSKTNANFLDAMQNKDVEAMSASLAQLKKETAEELEALQRFPGYRGNTGYRDAVRQQVELFASLANEDYPNVVKVIEKDQTELTSEDVALYNKTVERINKDLNQDNAKIQQAREQLMRENVPKPSIQTKRI